VETKPQPRTGRSARLLALDALRGLAAFYVVLYHYTCVFEEYCGHSPPLAHCIPYGRFAVYLFMMISGFVIIMTLERVGSWREFAVNRLARIYPAFWVAVLVAGLLGHFAELPELAHDPASVAANLTMIPGLLGFGLTDPVYWSLQAEICFYLWMGLLLASGRLHRAVHIAAAWMAVGIGWQLALRPTLTPAIEGWFRGLFLFDFIGWFGVGLVAYRFWRAARLHAPDWLVLGLWAPSVLLPEPETLRLKVLVAGVAFLLSMATVATGRARLLEGRALLWLGSISYALYLVHNVPGIVLMPALRDAELPWIAYMPVGIAVSVAAAWLLHIGVEDPAMTQIRRLWKAHLSRNPAPGPSTQ